MGNMVGPRGAVIQNNHVAYVLPDFRDWREGGGLLSISLPQEGIESNSPQTNENSFLCRRCDLHLSCKTSPVST
jgi:hypothetical protein